MPSNRLSSTLARISVTWADQLLALANRYAPNHLRPFIKSGVESKSDGVYKIEISINKNISPAGAGTNYKNGSSDAFAQEFGSGIRAKAGLIGKIPIRPKIKKVLAFNWEIANQNPGKFKFLPDGRVMFEKVKSPGIHPANSGRGYLGVSVNETVRRGLKELDNSVRKAISVEILSSFKDAKK